MPDEPRSESAPVRVGDAARGLAGAVVGGVGAVLFYLWLSSESLFS